MLYVGNQHIKSYIRPLVVLRKIFINEFLYNIGLVNLEYKLFEQRSYPLKLQFPADSFEAIELNIFNNYYFDANEIANADCILDLGAHVGTFTLFSLNHAKQKTHIIAVEPSIENMHILVRNIMNNIQYTRLKRLSLIRAAVWSEKRDLKLIKTLRSEDFKISVTNQYFSSNCSYEVVPSITMFDLLNMCQGRIIIKMDIEGAEIEAFRKPQWLHKINALSMEIHGNPKSLLKILKSYGFDAEYKELIIDPKEMLRKYYKSKISPAIVKNMLMLYRLTSSVVKIRMKRIKAVK